MKKYLCLFLFLFLSEITFSAVILIDPGHGGDDRGAQTVYWEKIGDKRIGRIVYEKDVALMLAKQIQKKLQKNHTTYLTRTIDRTVTLQERADLAEKIKADIFISVHLNSSEHKNSFGFETYYLDNHFDGAVKKVEQAENKLVTEDPEVQKILIDLVIQQTVDKSRKLSQLIHKKMHVQLKGKFGLPDRGNKAGLFYVLALSKRPGILIEPGFLSNPAELKKLLMPNFQEALAQSVLEGVTEFLQKKKKSTSYASAKMIRDVPLF